MDTEKLASIFKNPSTKSAWFNIIGYEPHPKQLLYHNSTARFKPINCGRRFGKTMMVARDLEPKLFIPNSIYWIVGSTYKLGEKEFRVIWNDIMIKLGLGKDKRIKRAYNKEQGNMKLEFPWNTQLYVMSADHPENLVGDGLDGVIMSEAAKHNKETWEKYVRPALTDRRGFADFPTTPESFNWYYDLWMQGQKDVDGVYESWMFPSWENKAIFPLGEKDPEILELRKSLGKTAFDQEIGAEFGSFSGKIYEEWDLTKHVTNITYNPNWPNYIAFDWGFTNPLAAVEFQVSPMDEIYIWRLHYKSKETVATHCNIMKSRDQPNGYKISLCFGDAADPEAASVVTKSLAPCVTDARAKLNWREGIDLVKSFLEREVGQDEFGGPIYAPALFVDKSCVDLIREFNTYKAREGSNGNNPVEAAVKKDDHALDALRYGLMHLFKLSANSHLSDVVSSNSTSNINNASPLFNPTSMYGLSPISGPSTPSSGFITKGGEF